MPLHLYVSVLSYLAVPCLVFVAYQDWTKRIRKPLSTWRSSLGLTSLLLISSDWCSVIFLIVAAEANLGWARPIDGNWFNYLSLAPVVAAPLALTLEGRARTCAIAASLSMGLFWATSWVE